VWQWDLNRDKTPVTRLLARTSILMAMILLGVNTAFAVDRTFQIEVENSLKGTVPPNWWLRASWRDQTLVVFVSPSAQHLENLCKAIPATIWSRINADQDIAVEQVVGGNGGKGSFQFSCRKYLAEKTD
jgi:hypothetical protein